MMGRKELSGFDIYHSDKVIISEDFFRFLSRKKIHLLVFAAATRSKGQFGDFQAMMLLKPCKLA